MTATLPSWTRELINAELSPQRVRASDELYARTRRHRIQLLDAAIDHPDVLQRIRELARSGKAVLVAVNSVRTAQEIAGSLSREANEFDLLLLHSRFSARDRLARERDLAARLAAGPSGRGLVTVATQVVEVSLDVDFDTIYTEVAPIEALLQRFGRVNRRGAKGIVDVHICTELTEASGHVYSAELVKRCKGVLDAVAGRVFDEAAAGDLIDEQYGQDLGAHFLEEASAGAKQFRAACLDRLYAFESDPELEDAFDELFDGAEVLPDSLLPGYLARFERSPVDASSFLVPISWRQLQGLRRAGLLERSPEPRAQRFRPWLARVAYDERGLQLSLPSVTETA